MKRTKCAICKEHQVPDSPYYPNLVCTSCEDKAVDGDGNKVTFHNESFGGGIIAHHTTRNGHKKEDFNMTCFINGIECYGVEFKFGGTGIAVGKEGYLEDLSCIFST